jgi:1-acyl-sn-glycerol-3-phosphate acyltransferase
MLSLVRSILFALIFYPGSAIAAISALAIAPISKRALFTHVRWWAMFHRLCARFILGIRSRVEGVFPPGPVIVAMKHESMFETIEVLVLLDDPAVVLKRELADIPGWGRAARLHGVIAVDREAGGTAMRRMLRAAKDAVAARRTIMIFPEGTRVLPGQQPPLRAGFAGLYRSLNLPVVPVACDSGRLWPRHRFTKRPGVVTFKVGETIPPGLSREDVEARVHAAINALNEGSRT